MIMNKLSTARGSVSGLGLGLGSAVAAAVTTAVTAWSSRSLSRVLVVEPVETLGRVAVEVEPPVADEVLLVEDGSVGAEHAVGLQTSEPVVRADMESLAFCGWVSVVTSLHLTVAAEASGRHLGKDGIVLSGDARDVDLQVIDSALAAAAAGASTASSLISTELTGHSVD